MGAEKRQGHHGSPGVVEGGLAAQALGQDILDAGKFQHRADRTACDHTGTWGSGADQHTGGAVATVGQGRDRTVTGEGHLHEMLLAIGDTLADGADHVTGLADADADLAFLVADDDDGPEAHLLAAFHGLGDTADLHHALLPFRVALLIASITATTAAFATLTAATTALFLLLAFSCCRNISCAGHGVWIGLGGGIGHG